MEIDQTVDGAMFQSPMKMDMRVPDALMLEMTHGTVEINMIPLPAHQDGLVTRPLENVLWPTQEMDSEVSQLVKTTAKDQAQDQVHTQTNTDAIPPAISAKHVRREILDAAQTDQPNAQTARTQIQPNSINVTELMLTIQNVRPAQRVTQPDVCQEVKLVTVAHQSQIFSNVIQRH